MNTVRPIQIRRPVISELESVTSFLLHCWHVTFSPFLSKDTIDTLCRKNLTVKRFEDALHDPTKTILCAFEHNIIIGLIQLSPVDEGRVYLDLLYLNELVFGKGIADQLIKRALRNYPPELTLILEVAKQNKRAIAYYQKRGFVMYQEKCETIDREQIDSFLMQKEFTQGV